MRALRALLVDLDGTLVDTSVANFAAYEAALADVGATMTLKWWTERGFGRSWRQFLPELLADRPDVDPQAVAAAKARLYPQFFDRVRVNAGLVGLLQALRPEVRSALVTTASRAGAEAVLEHHQLSNLFDTLVTGDDVSAHKPAPEAYSLAASRLEVEAEDCLIIEDSDIGAAAARAFGAPYLLVPEIESR